MNGYIKHIHLYNGILFGHKKEQSTNEVPKHAIAWVNLKNILSERCQSQKTTLCVIPYL